MSDQEKEKYCRGCRNDYYNHREQPGFDGSTKCWSLEDAEVVQRYRIGWWTPQDSARNYTRVTTLSCHHAPGQFAFMKELPEHLRHQKQLARSES